MNDSLNLEILPDLIETPGDVKFSKYGVGAYLLEYAPVQAILLLGGSSVLQQHDLGPYPLKKYSGAYHCLLAALTVVIIYLLLLSRLGARGAFFGASLAGLCPGLVYFSYSASVNIPFLLYGTCALFFMDRWACSPRFSWAILTGVFSAFAFVNKEFFGLFMLGMSLVFAVRLREEKRPLISKGGIFRSMTALAAFIFVAGGLSLLWLNPDIYLQHLSVYLSDDAATKGVERATFWQPRPILLYFVPAFFETFVDTTGSYLWGAISLAGLFAAFRKRQYRPWAILLSPFFYFLLVLVRYDAVNHPYLLVLLPLFAYWGAAGIGYVRDCGYKNVARVFGVMTVIGLAAQSAFLQYDLAHNPLQKAEVRLTELIREDPGEVAVFDLESNSGPNKNNYRSVLMNQERLTGKGGPIDTKYILVQKKVITELLKSRGTKATPDAIASIWSYPSDAPGMFWLEGIYENSRGFWKQKFNGLNVGYCLYKRAD